jgi:hypothetical protein
MRNAGALLLGFGTGLGFTLLFTPYSGRKTQELIGRKLRYKIHPLVAAGEEVVDEIKSLPDKGITHVGDVIAAAKSAYAGDKAWQDTIENVRPLDQAL